MLKHITLSGAAALGLLLSGAAFAQDDVTADTVVVTVGETEITLGEMIIARSQLPPQYAQLPDDVLFTGIVDQLVQQQLLADAAESVPPRIDFTLQNERRSLLAGETINKLVEDAVTDEAVNSAYEERFADMEEVPEYNAAHLLVETEEEAAAAKARIDEGEEFADVARDVSTGPTGPNGGDLGWFAPGAMVPEFEEAVNTLEKDEVTEPFETQFGWHVAKLRDKRIQEKPTLDAVRQELTGEIQEAAVTAYLEDLEADTTVVRPEEGAFDPAVLNNLGLLDQQTE